MRRLLSFAGIAAAVGFVTGAAANPPAPAPAAAAAPAADQKSAEKHADKPADKPAPKRASKSARKAAGKAAAKPAAKKKPASKASSRSAKPTAKSKHKASKPTTRRSKKKHRAKRTRKDGEPGKPNEAIRRAVSGAPAPIGTSIQESPELRALREIDLALFPSATPNPGPPWPADGSLLLEPGEPRLDASGMPPSGLLASPTDAPAVPTSDISWLRQLDMPDIPVRWDGRVVRYLEYYKNTPRGRSAVVLWMKKSGRYGAAIRRILREQGLPEDILWLSLVESGFNPTIHSPAGAAGLWQFMPHGARVYGLTVDRWVDERLDPERSTLAAARYLSDLRQRFGGWELAFAAYNMGYGGLLASIRKYNTNDFWELSHLEAGLPLETALYVPKIIALAIVARNRKVFNCDDIELDPPVTFDKVAIGAGISLRSVASASGAGSADIEALNPHLIAHRTPPPPLGTPLDTRFEVRVPPGAGARAAKSIPRLIKREPKLKRYAVRWGESLEDIASARGVSRSTLKALNGLRSGESPRPGTLLFVPARTSKAGASSDDPEDLPIIVVPAQRFSYPDRRRVFYRVVSGDTVRDIAAVLGVALNDLCRWNAVDPAAVLHDGMTFQAYLPRARRLDRVALLEENDARVLEVGTDAFFAHFEGLKGRKRVEIIAAEGDNWRKLARRYGLTSGMLERINHRSRRSKLHPGDKVVVYVPVERVIKPPAVEPEPPEPAKDPDVAVAAAEPAEQPEQPEQTDDSAPDAATEDDGKKPAALRTDVPDSAEDAAHQDESPSPPSPPSQPSQASAAPPPVAGQGEPAKP